MGCLKQMQRKNKIYLSLLASLSLNHTVDHLENHILQSSIVLMGNERPREQTLADKIVTLFGLNMFYFRHGAHGSS